MFGDVIVLNKAIAGVYGLTITYELTITRVEAENCTAKMQSFVINKFQLHILSDHHHSISSKKNCSAVSSCIARKNDLNCFTKIYFCV